MILSKALSRLALGRALALLEECHEYIPIRNHYRTG